SKAKGEIIVTYPEALFEKVVDPQHLAKNRVQMVIGEDLDVDILIEMLIEFGFKREDFVYEPGQFSIRGGIIDIFSYGNEYPYRVELFDTEVETIRLFNPANQLSIRSIKEVSIVPNINTQFDQNQKVSLLEILPDDTVLWVRDFQILLDKLQQCFEKAQDFAEQISNYDEKDLVELFKDRAFIKPNQVIDEAQRLSTVLLTEGPQPLATPDRVTFLVKPQPNFNKNFKLLIQDLEEQQNEGREIFIFTDNPKQIERFYAIFEDLQAKVKFHPVMVAINAGFLDVDAKMACYTDHQIFQRFHRYKLRRGFTKDKSLNLKLLRELKSGDYVTHIDHGVGKYSGLEKIEVNGHVQESVRLFYKNNDVLYVGINSLHKISKYVGKEGTPPRVSKLGSDTWKNLKQKTKRKVKDIASELIKLYAKRKASEGFAFPEDGYLQNELEASFMYEDTPDQLKATIDVKNDMMKTYPMDRLVCGDVGFGKTEVAIRGAFKAVIGGKQVAILVPTTILALQHYKTFSSRLKEFGITVDYVNRFRTTKEKQEIFAKLKEGKIDIVIGTHAILNKEIGFQNLGLLVIDEEQKFGVASKEKLRKLKPYFLIENGVGADDNVNFPF
ncbi:MAG: DEAD/DEAH box helicase, partial [Bacteroidota bacterium]